MTAKYNPASLLIVSRILGTPTPRYNDLMSRVCTTMSAKTTMSKSTDILLNSWDGGKVTNTLTEGEGDGYQSDRPAPWNIGETHLIQRQRIHG